MANLVEWVENATKDEKILGCVIGEHGSYWKHKNKLLIEGKLISWEQAKHYLDYEFDDSYGSPGCHAIYVWTENYILFISNYDGSTNYNMIPRNPIDCNPFMPGGG